MTKIILAEEEKRSLVEKCRGRSLKDLHPELVKEWHPTMNGDLTPEMVAAQSNKKVWWLYPYDDPVTGRHIDLPWAAVVAHRARGQKCPFLTGNAVLPGFNDLGTVRSDLATEWHPTMNGDLTPEMVTAQSGKKVWWLYPYDDPVTGRHIDFIWQASILNRFYDRGCPYLTGKAVWPGFNDLATVMPSLALEWHPTRNSSLTPERVTAHSNKKVWWCCSKGHEWSASINDRACGKGCPYCKSSRGEIRISNFCKDHNISSLAQYVFDDCVYKRKLPFDRAIFRNDGELAFVVEYDGEQHYKPVDFSRRINSKKEFEKVQIRDRVKNEYCRENRIPLVRISYRDFDNIETILLKKMVRHGLI